MDRHLTHPVPRARPPWWVVGLLVLVSAEMGLRVFTHGYRWWTARARAPHAAERTPSPHGEAGLTVLCLGDSHTFGYGADWPSSYPRQLERFLRDRWPERRIRVINAGETALNSSQVLHRLDGYLADAPPELVLLNVGHNDLWNFRDTDVSVVDGSWRVRAGIRLDQVLSRVHLYRLAKLIGRGRRERGLATGWTPARLRAELGEILATEPYVARQVLQNPTFPLPARWTASDLDDQAQPWVRQALERLPGALRPLLRLGRLFYRHRREHAAQQVYHWAEGMAATAQDVLRVRAERAMARMEFTQAQPLWEQLIAQAPAIPEFYVGLAEAQRRQGAFDDAIASARTAIALELDTAEAYLIMGQAFMAQRRWPPAQAAYQRAVELDPSNIRSWSGFARVTQHMGQLQRARQIWLAGFRQAPHSKLLRGLGRTYPELDRGREAMREALEETRANVPYAAAYWRSLEHFLQYGNRPAVVSRLLRANLERIVTRTAAHGVRLGILTYPGLREQDGWVNPVLREIAPQWVNPVLRETATRHADVLLLDADEALSDRFADPALDLMSPDAHHLSAEGYGLLARYVMDTLVAAEVLEDAR